MEMRGRPSLHSRILGSLIGSAAGDAMGAATEARTTEQILECFGHRVTDFETHGHIRRGQRGRTGDGRLQLRSLDRKSVV